MSLIGLACVCGGSNENCRFCFGTGVRPKRSPSDTPYLASQMPRRREPVRRRPLIKCPECSAEVTRLGRHRHKVHGGKGTAGQATGAGRFGSVAYSVAKSKGRSDAVPAARESQRRTPGQSPERVLARSRGDARERSREVRPDRKLVRCPHCGGSVRADRSAQHIRKVHGRPAPSRVAQKRGISHPGSRHRDLEIPATTQEETRRSRLLDATKDYAHTFREAGRYGSHPSHDRFDDDSNP